MTDAERQERDEQAKALMREIDAALERRDAAAVAALLKAGRDKKPMGYPNPLHREWESRRAWALQFLYEALPFEDFLKLHESRVSHQYEIRRIIETGPITMTAKEARQVWEKWGPLSFGADKRLVETLATEPTQWVTDWCRDFIEKCSPQLDKQPKVPKKGFLELNRHADNSGIDAHIALLCRRDDPEAKELVQQYLISPPWGYNWPSLSLLWGVAQSPVLDGRQLLRGFLERNQQPGTLRLMAIRAFATLEPESGFLLLFEDLKFIESAEARRLYFKLIEEECHFFPGGLGHKGSERSSIVAESISELRISQWPWADRAWLALILEEKYRKRYEIEDPGFRAKLGLILVRDYEKWRLDWHDRTVLPVTALVGFLGYGAMKFFDARLGLASPLAEGISKIALLGLVLVVFGSARSHLSGFEPLKDKVAGALIYFGMPLVFLGSLFLGRGGQ